MSTTTLLLSQLVVSPKNVRPKPGDVTALAASIAAQGLLQNIVVSATESGTYQVDAGGRGQPPPDGRLRPPGNAQGRPIGRPMGRYAA